MGTKRKMTLISIWFLLKESTDKGNKLSNKRLKG